MEPEPLTPEQTQACKQMAAFLNHMRTKRRQIPLNAAETFLRIASGTDHAKALKEEMQAVTPEHTSTASVARMIALLRGRCRYAAGTWVDSPYSLIEVRRHPHRWGQQLLLSAEGRALVQQFFPANGRLANLHRESNETTDVQSLVPTADEEDKD